MLMQARLCLIILSSVSKLNKRYSILIRVQLFKFPTYSLLHSMINLLIMRSPGKKNLNLISCSWLLYPKKLRSHFK